ncbi:MAG: GntR family transcriptional regulator [Spirochaetes bacterium]|nr:GntR family transcriptional regulator [Spirochaetota bacterium]
MEEIIKTADMTDLLQRSKKNLVYETLKNRIVRNDLKPLSYLNEKELSRELGTSKTPIREALQELGRNRFVIIIPNKGCFVSNISLEDIREIFELREIYECAAARIAASKPDKEKLVTELNHYETVASKDSIPLKERLLAGYQIHSAIVESVGNQRLQEVYRTLQDHIVRIRIYFLNRYLSERVNASEEEHREIVQAIVQGDPGKAEQAMRRHIENALQFIRNYF